MPRLLPFLLLGLASFAAQAGVYTYVDAEGNRVFTDQPQSEQAERVEIQRLLTARGFYRDEIDGKIGTGTMEAISAFQRSIGVPPDGYATSIVLGQLRGR